MQRKFSIFEYFIEFLMILASQISFVKIYIEYAAEFNYDENH